MELSHCSITRSPLLRFAVLLVAVVTLLPVPASGDDGAPGRASAVTLTPSGCARDRVLVTAHRGTGPGTRTIAGLVYSENSIPAFELALRAGADGVEADYWPTAEGRIAAHHDSTLDRMTAGRGALGRRRWARVESLRLPSGARVPTFGAVAAALAPYGGHRQQEIKDGAAFSTRQLRRMVADDLALVAPAFDRVLYTSSQLDTLARIQAIDPRVRVGLIARAPTARPRLSRLPVWLDVALVDLRAADASYVRRAAAAGVEVSARGVNTVAELHLAAELGVTRVLTDRPEVIGRAC
jgi:glycerophosphoryl diester phosphodiesterase